MISLIKIIELCLIRFDQYLIRYLFNQMAQKRKPQPERFDVYTITKDKKGFTIPGSQYVFTFDRHGGWYDEYSNYYDRDGNPTDQRDDSDRSDSRSNHSDYDDDPYENQYGRPKDYDEEQQPQNFRALQKIADNTQRLGSYPSHEPLRVYFSNVAYTTRKGDLLSYFKQKVVGIADVFFYNNQKGQFNGNGYFVVRDGRTAEELVRLQGEKFNNRDVRFEIDPVEDFLQDPLEQDELKNVGKKEGKWQRKEEKVEVAQLTKQVESVKIEAKQQTSVKPQPKQNLEQFVYYVFERDSFPKKTSFRDWTVQNGFDDKTDIKDMQKIEGNQKFAKVLMKRKVFNKLNGKSYQGKAIVFKPE